MKNLRLLRTIEDAIRHLSPNVLTSSCVVSARDGLETATLELEPGSENFLFSDSKSSAGIGYGNELLKR